ncbi:hypothetical protein Q8F55_001309 [Vanrija albida]|uniref:Transcription elongation regulator 1 n=1 Tax=Vanrija albida TaxID=181172 RepID=A0ABR3QFP4_9TREE
MSGAGPGRAPPGPPPGGPSGAPGGRVPPGPPTGGPAAYNVPLQGYPGFSVQPSALPAHAMPNFPPPLPPGWSEHRAPDGVTPYFYNSTTKESTYTRPTILPPGVSAAPAAPSAEKDKKKKKEKPKNKVPVPGTEWTRVTTNEGNVFYFHKESKRSEWTVPEEIAEAVAALEETERAEQEEKAKEERLERLREQERVRAEVEEERKRKAKEKEERKRKAVESGDAPKPKQQKVDEEQFEPDGQEDEEAWRKAVAAEFDTADKAAADQAAKEEEEGKKREEEAAKKVFAAPEKVKVSEAEGRALFKALLMEKNISPFAPWDQALPSFINDPRYVLLNSEKDRREAYEEYCREAGRARRLGKHSTATTEKKADPERDFRALMRDEVTSTRTRFDDFKRQWKKDRRFYSFGRDDRDREKAFKVHLRELGERKRADAKIAEADFYELLKETDSIGPESEWAAVKKLVASDPRYDAVGSSSLRAELFASHVKKLAEGGGKPETAEEAAERKIRERKERQQASLRDRESKVREHQVQVSADVDKSRTGATREQGERVFGSLLTDVVRDHTMTWEEAQQTLSKDPRFNPPALRPGDKRRLFEERIAQLGSSKSNALSKLFATHATELDTDFSAIYDTIAEDPLVARLGLDSGALEDRFDAWQRARESEARREFDTLLGENTFVDFWGRMRNKVTDEAAAAVKELDERDEGEGIGEGGDADISKLAGQIDLAEIKQVLRRDKRYRQFDHIPEIREQWIRDYLENLEGTKGSETIHQAGQ